MKSFYEFYHLLKEFTDPGEISQGVDELIARPEKAGEIFANIYSYLMKAAQQVQEAQKNLQNLWTKAVNEYFKSFTSTGTFHSPNDWADIVNTVDRMAFSEYINQTNQVIVVLFLNAAVRMKSGKIQEFSKLVDEIYLQFRKLAQRTSSRWDRMLSELDSIGPKYQDEIYKSMQIFNEETIEAAKYYKYVADVMNQHFQEN
jgi:hypothetical protein